MTLSTAGLDMIGDTPVQSTPGQQTITDSIAGVYAVAHG